MYGTFHYADRSGLVDDRLCSNAIVAFSEGDNPSRWLKVEEYMKRMEAVRVARLEGKIVPGAKRRAEKARLRVINVQRRHNFAPPLRLATLVAAVSDLGTTTVKNPKKFLHGGGRYGGAMFWWVDPLVSGGMGPELKHVFCKMCKVRTGPRGEVTILLRATPPLRLITPSSLVAGAA